MFTIENVAKVLTEKDNIVILCHRSPDGDTIGAAFALYDALLCIGKTVRIECADEFGSRFSHITNGVIFPDFVPEYVVAVDVPDNNLLGTKKEEYPEVDMCIDHHGTHVPFAKYTYVESTAASACEIMYEVCCALNGDVNSTQAVALYTGVATDTGCFRFSNTTVRTHIIAGKLLEKNIDYMQIHQNVFANSKTRALLEAKVVNEARFFYNDKVAIQFVNDEIKDSVGACDDDVCALASTLQNINCVLLGITLRQTGENTFRLSVRSKKPVSAADFCRKFGGGGHTEAAGCTIEGDFADVYQNLIIEAENILKDNNLLEV